MKAICEKCGRRVYAKKGNPLPHDVNGKTMPKYQKTVKDLDREYLRYRHRSRILRSMANPRREQCV